VPSEAAVMERLGADSAPAPARTPVDDVAAAAVAAAGGATGDPMREAAAEATTDGGPDAAAVVDGVAAERAASRSTRGRFPNPCEQVGAVVGTR
jgi:hypothetical protein